VNGQPHAQAALLPTKHPPGPTELEAGLKFVGKNLFPQSGTEPRLPGRLARNADTIRL
jgi:hypothetical protein